MTDEKVKEAVERLTEFAEAVDWQPTDTCTINGRTISCEDLRAILAHCDALQAERDKLAVENDALDAALERSNKELFAAEAKLTALVEALNDALSFINEAGGACLGLAMSGSNHPNPDGVQMDISRRAMTLAHTICQALAHHSAPVDPQPGEIRVIGGVRQRFIEHGDVGQVWEPLSTTPTSAPVADVGGLTADDLERLRRLISRQRLTSHCGEGTFERRERERQNEFIDRALAALIQPQGEERS